MHLKFKEAYVSIKTFSVPGPLPKLIVVTGRNGCGKTHLLRAIENGNIGAHNSQDEPIKRIKLFNYESLTPKDETIDQGNLAREKQTIWNTVNGVANRQKANAQQQLADEPGRPLSDDALKALYEALSDHLTHDDASGSLSEKQRQALEIKSQALAELQSHAGATYKQPTDAAQANVADELKRRGTRVEDILELLQKKTPIPLFFLDFPTFQNLYDPFIAYDPFQRSYSMWFSRYLEEWRRNRDDRDNRERLGHTDTEYKTDEEFARVYGGFPWEEIRNFFADIDLPFSISAPKAGSQEPFRAILTDPDKNVIDFNHLSSGEKILLSLVSALSYAREKDALATLPELLLLDEIDAPLHPAMTNFLLKTLENTFVNRQGISVILTTHSPSTVAMAPDESLYELKKTGSAKKLVKVTKDAAITRLTAGVPTLSVSCETRRLVLVESEHDANYYTRLDNIIRYSKRDEAEPREAISLYFHPAGGPHFGGCDLVKEHAKTLRAHGVNNVFGVIDWDKKNGGDEAVFVLGENQGYSIETFLLDPLVVGCLLLQAGDPPNRWHSLKPNP